MQHFIGFDCATKSLGVAYITYDTSQYNTIALLATKLKTVVGTTDTIKTVDLNKILDILKQIQSALDHVIYVRGIELYNLLGDKQIKDVPFVEKMRFLKVALNKVSASANFTGKISGSTAASADITSLPKILVEYQMSANFKSHDIFTGIIYHFAENDVQVIGPSLKQKIAFGSDGRYSHFLKKYSSNYAANKAHSKFNVVEWLTVFNQIDMIKNIKQSNLDDVGDAVLMTIAHIFKSNGLMTGR